MNVMKSDNTTMIKSLFDKSHMELEKLIELKYGSDEAKKALHGKLDVTKFDREIQKIHSAIAGLQESMGGSSNQAGKGNFSAGLKMLIKHETGLKV